MFTTNAAVGGWVNVMVCDEESLQPLVFVSTNLTLYVPVAKYVFVGFVAVDVVPSPKLQLYVVEPGVVAVNTSAKLLVQPVPPV